MLKELSTFAIMTALLAGGLAALFYTGWFTHVLLGRLCTRHAMRFCRRRGLEVCRARWQPEFEPSGVKTEFTLVQLDCLDDRKHRRLVLLSVWPFGVRKKVSDEPYPDSLDSEWACEPRIPECRIGNQEQKSC